MHTYPFAHRFFPSHQINIQRVIFGFLCAAAMLASSAFAQEPKPPLGKAPEVTMGKVNFPDNLLTTIPASLRIVKLSPTAAPEPFLKETLGKLGVETKAIQPLSRMPHLRGKRIPESMVGVLERRELRAHWDRKTGASEIFPQLDKLKGATFERQGSPQMSRAVSSARELFTRPDILPHDATQFTVGEPRPVLGVRSEHGSESKAEPQLFLTYVPAFRTVSGYKVYGTGSRAALAMANDGSIQGFVRRWKSGALAGTVEEKRSAREVRSALMKMLEPMAKGADLDVLSAEVAYYDGDTDAMAPVYRVLVRVHPHEVRELPRAQKISDILIARYLAYGNTELPPQLTPERGPKPQTAPAGKLEQRQPPPGDPLVGRYVVRNAEWGFVDEANAFWNGLSFWLFGPGPFSNSQYYWATPGMYIGGENTFVNSMNIALTEGHGNNWLFTTNSNCCDIVDITAITAAGGYGASAGGRLDFWIIHSCSVIPSAADRADWYSPWWDVFQGLHSVLGSRTEMLFDGGAVNFPFGFNLRLGASVVSAWFNANLSYAQSPYDRPSTISVCGRADDNAYNTDALQPAGCLINFWQPN